MDSFKHALRPMMIITLTSGGVSSGDSLGSSDKIEFKSRSWAQRRPTTTEEDRKS